MWPIDIYGSAATAESVYLVYRFQASKDQLRIVRSLHRFLSGDMDRQQQLAAATPVSPPLPTGHVHTPQASGSLITRILRGILISAACATYPSLSPADLASCVVNATPTSVISKTVQASVTVAPPKAEAPLFSSNIAFIVCSALNKSSGLRRPPKASTAVAESTCSLLSTDAGKRPVRPADVASSIAPSAHALYLASISRDADSLHRDASVQFLPAPSGHINIIVIGGLFRIADPPEGEITEGSASFVTYDTSSAGACDETAPSLEPPHIQKRARSRKSHTGTSDPAKIPLEVSAEASSSSLAHTWRVDTVPAAFDEEAFELYKRCVCRAIVISCTHVRAQLILMCRYQVAVHGDAPEEVTRKGYTNFLCSTPLLREPLGAPSAAGAFAGVSGSGASVASVTASPSAAAALRALIDMGFPEATAAAALTRAKGDASAALEMLLGGPGSGDWSSPEAQALKRCAEAVSSAWRDGEGGGAGLSLQHCPEACASDPSDVASGPCITYYGFREGREHIFPDLPAPGKGSPQLAEAQVLSLGYGSFHQRYYIDDRLVAVGVVDVLPHCLSSVYLFYDPELGRRLALGKLTALREIQWVQAAMAISPRFRYYYMG